MLLRIITTAMLMLPCLPLSAQPGGGLGTLGVPGFNDKTVNGQGSGLASCVPLQFAAGQPMTVAASALPNSPIIMGMACFCLPGVIPLQPPFSIDLDPASLVVVIDGTGLLIPPNSVTPFMHTDGSGAFSLTATPMDPGAFAIQCFFVNALYPGGVAASQAFDIVLTPPALCQNTVGGDLAPLSDDGFVNLPLSGTGFTFYATTWTQIFVNMNGNLTFNLPDSQWSPTEALLLGGVPRIAPAWYDFAPQNQGTVRAFDDGSLLQVEWSGVVSFGSSCLGTPGHPVDFNSFCATLTYGTGDVRLDYGLMQLCSHGGGAASDMIAGLSPGGLPASATNLIDLNLGTHLGGPALPMYELFTGSTDLSNLTTGQGLGLVFQALPGGGYNESAQP